jgi:hypothetical protein
MATNQAKPPNQRPHQPTTTATICALHSSSAAAHYRCCMRCSQRERTLIQRDSPLPSLPAPSYPAASCPAPPNHLLAHKRLQRPHPASKLAGPAATRAAGSTDLLHRGGHTPQSRPNQRRTAAKPSHPPAKWVVGWRAAALLLLLLLPPPPLLACTTQHAVCSTGQAAALQAVHSLCTVRYRRVYCFTRPAGRWTRSG